MIYIYIHILYLYVHLIYRVKLVPGDELLDQGLIPSPARRKLSWIFPSGKWPI